MKTLILIVAVALTASCGSVKMGHIDGGQSYFYPGDIPVEFVESALTEMTTHYISYEGMFDHNGDSRKWVSCSVEGLNLYVYNDLSPEDEAGCLDHELGHKYSKGDSVASLANATGKGHNGWTTAPYATSRFVPGTNGTKTNSQSERLQNWEPYNYDSMVMAKYGKYLSQDCADGSKPVSMQVVGGEPVFNCK